MSRRGREKELVIGNLFGWPYNRRESDLSNKTDNFVVVFKQDEDASDKRNQSEGTEKDNSRLCGGIYNKQSRPPRETSGVRYLRAGNRWSLIRDSSSECSHDVENESILGCDSSFRRYQTASNGHDLSCEVGERSHNTSNLRSKSCNSIVSSNWREGNSREEKLDSSGIRRVRDKSVGRNFYEANGRGRSGEECVRSRNRSNERSKTSYSSIMSNWRTGNERRKDPDSPGRRCAAKAGSRVRDYSRRDDQSANDAPNLSGRFNRGSNNGHIASRDSSGGRSRDSSNERYWWE